MFFILQVAQRGCERELRGIQRLLCTLLCTAPFHIQIQFCPSAAPVRYTHAWLPPLMIVRPLLQNESGGCIWGIRSAIRAASLILEGLCDEIPRISAPFV